MWPTRNLASSPLWAKKTEHLSFDDRVKLSHERCESILKIYNLTSTDIRNISPKYWQLHSDPIWMNDIAAATLMTIHLNLCIGTLALYESVRPDVKILVDKLLRYEIYGQYCLTEVGHGLDVINMETTATMLPSGEFELHTPTQNAAKFMPPTAPCGMPTVAVVFARLVVGGEDRGVRPFLVYLNDGRNMSKNIVCKILPPRGGSRPVKHALTYFDSVRLPSSALLGPVQLDDDPRTIFFKGIHRVITGTLSMGTIGISGIRVASYIAAKYSLWRLVSNGSSNIPRAIITFSTQHIPVLTAIAQSLVLDKFSEASRCLFVQSAGNLTMRHFTAAVFKATVMRLAIPAPVILGDRCGARGLFEANHLSTVHAELRGAAIAEGDTLAISIKFGIEMLLGRVTPPEAQETESLLYKRETSLLAELRQFAATFSSHRNPAFERTVLPQCQSLLESVGQRMAYEAAIAARLDRRLIDLFVASIMKLDPAWFSENVGISRAQQLRLEQEYAWSLLPDIRNLIDLLGVDGYVDAPIVSQESWDAFVESLETIGQPSLGIPPARSHL